MLERIIAALNSLNQPWVAITVIIIGIVFDMECKRFGVANDAATGVIGAGIGLLTGQGLKHSDPPPPPANPTTAAPSPQEKTK